MSIVDLSDIGGVQPKALCAESRARIVNYHKTEDGVACRFYTDGYQSPNFPEIESAAVVHIRGCRACVVWLKRVVSERALRRGKRMGDYCCWWMFAAVEEPGSLGLSMHFGLYRDEDPCWFIDKRAAFAQFCPWCGARLPSGPFDEKPERVPNQPPDPTSPSVTPPAGAGRAPSIAADH